MERSTCVHTKCFNNNYFNIPKFTEIESILSAFPTLLVRGALLLKLNVWKVGDCKFTPALGFK